MRATDDWSLPDDLAGAVLDRLGVPAPTGPAAVDDLIDALARRVPRGSTTKLEAMAAGRTPPGYDPVEVAERWLADPRLAWSCWAVCGLTAALVRAGGALDAGVVATRRCEPGAPPVDIHSLVRVAGEEEVWLCDPHFGVGLLPPSGGSWSRPTRVAILTPGGGNGGEGRVELEVTGPSRSATPLTYRQLTGPLDRGDVRAFCDISVTYSGVPARPGAWVQLAGGAASLRTDPDSGALEMQVWRPADPPIDDTEPVRTVPASWEEGMDALLARAW